MRHWTAIERAEIGGLIRKGLSARQIAARYEGRTAKSIECLASRYPELRNIGFKGVGKRGRPGCKIAGCEKPSVGQGMCNKHYRRWKRHDNPEFRLIPYPENKGDCFQWLKDHQTFDGGECLRWPFHRDQSGYGRVRVMGKSMAASRFMCELVRGAPPSPEHQAAHSCGNGHLGCVNPRHLRWATPKENMEDLARHLREGKPTAFYEAA